MWNYFLALTFVCMHPFSVVPMQHFINETLDLFSFENWCGNVPFSATADNALRVTVAVEPFQAVKCTEVGCTLHPGQAARSSLAAWHSRQTLTHTFTPSETLETVFNLTHMSQEPRRKPEYRCRHRENMPSPPAHKGPDPDVNLGHSGCGATELQVFLFQSVFFSLASSKKE